MKNFFFSVLLLGILNSSVNSQTIQWQQLNGPHGGTAISFASNEDGDIFAGSSTLHNAVNRSTDDGYTWLMSSNGIHDIGYRSIEAIYVTENSNIVIGTFSPNGSRIYRSTDNGNNWYVVAPDFGAKAFAADNDGDIYANGTINGGLHKSTDNGVNWQQVSLPSNYAGTDVAVNGNGDIFITGYEIWRSTDDGNSWVNVGDGYIGAGVMVTSIAINNSGHIFVGCTQEYASNSGILKSTDNGETWTQVKMGIRIGDHHNIVINNQGQIFAGSFGWGIWESTDDGLNWTQHYNGLQHIYIRSVHISNGVLYAGTEEGGIYRSDDWAENWVQVGCNAAIVKKISISPANGNFFTAVSGVSRSTDSGQTWEPVNYGLADYGTNSFAIKNDGTIFCCTKGTNMYYLPTVFRSTNNGNSWVVIDTGLSQYSSKNAIILDQQEDVYIIDQDAVYKSSNNGDSWFSIGGPGGATDLAFNSAGDLFASKSQVIWRKLNGDPNWVQFFAPWVDKLFISSKDYIFSAQFRSTDNGETWTTMASLGGYANIFNENSLGHLFAGLGYGVYRSTDDGENWTQVNDGLTYTGIISLAIDSEGYVYAGTNGRSIFKTTSSTVGSIEAGEYFPTTFSLFQNYPNPFNPKTVISYQLPVSGNVKLNVYDLLGREVATLVDEYKPAGKYEVEFNSSSGPSFRLVRNLSSGIYFYKLQAGEYTAAKKMILVK